MVYKDHVCPLLTSNLRVSRQRDPTEANRHSEQLVKTAFTWDMLWHILGIPRCDVDQRPDPSHAGGSGKCIGQ